MRAGIDNPTFASTLDMSGDNAQVWPYQKGRLIHWIAISGEEDVNGNGTQVQKVNHCLRAG